MIDNLKFFVKDFFWARGKCRNKNLLHYINEIEEKGFCVINNFLTENESDKLKELGEMILKKNSDKIQKESKGADKRIYGVEKIEEKFLIPDKMGSINEIAKFLNKKKKLNYFQLLGKITYLKGNLGSGSGWHRDSPFSNQFKSIVYLTDVDENNGPFQYIKGSHKYKFIKEYSSFLKVSLSRYRFDEEEADKIINHFKSENVTFKAKKGTAIIVNTRGLHRGKPLSSGERMALTRYYL